MQSLLFVLLILGCANAGVLHAGCHSAKPAFGPASQYTSDTVDLMSAQKLVGTHKYGKLFEVEIPNAATPNSSQTVHVVHVYGTPEQWGEAAGTLLGSRVSDFGDRVWGYLEAQVEDYLDNLPKWLSKLIGDVGLDVALDITYDLTKKYTRSYIIDELDALCKASGADYKIMRRIHMLAGLTQGACSTVSAWGAALDPESPTKQLQLRALDWNMDGPFRDFSSITVYHPAPSYGNKYINVGMVGLVGSLTGMSEAQLAISEIGVSYPDPSFGKESRVGVPFIFMLRDILSFDHTIDDAISRMTTARRTCDLILGVADGKLGYGRGFQYSYSHLEVLGPENMKPFNSTWHKPLPDTLYWGMDWLCPTFNTVLHAQLSKYHGKLTPEIARSQVSAVQMSGDNHLAWYDTTNTNMWVAFAAPFGVGGPVPAYWRQYLFINGTQAFAMEL